MNIRLNMEYDPNFEPMARSRAQTWPMNRLDLKPEDSEDNQQTPSDGVPDDSARESGMGTPNSLNAQPSSSISPTGSALPGSASKKNSSRRNAWGNQSYADLITQAIQSDPQRRLTLSQIYEWMVANVAFFRDKGDSNSSAGWKNSIRHNLSLHNRFVRVQNEGTGKSSWWMINPDAKPGKSTRRRASTMDTQKYEKKRGRTKKLEERRHIGLDSSRGPNSPISEGGEHYNLESLSPLHPIPDVYRSRTNSSASSFGRISPVTGNYEDNTPVQSPQPWPAEYGRQGESEFQPQMAEIDKMAHSMKLHDNLLIERRSPLTTLRPGQSSASYYQNSPRYSFPGSVGPSLESLPPYSTMSSVNPSIFSGGTFCSIPEEPAKIRPDLTPQQNVVFRRPLNLPSNSSNGAFPSDLDSFMETIQPGLDCDIEQVLQRELEIGGNLDFDFDSMGGLLLNANSVPANSYPSGTATNSLPSINGPKSGLPQKWQ